MSIFALALSSLIFMSLFVLHSPRNCNIPRVSDLKLEKGMRPRWNRIGASWSPTSNLVAMSDHLHLQRHNKAIIIMRHLCTCVPACDYGLSPALPADFKYRAMHFDIGVLCDSQMSFWFNNLYWLLCTIKIKLLTYILSQMSDPEHILKICFIQELPVKRSMASLDCPIALVDVLD